jgi:hypothetical protein
VLESVLSDRVRRLERDRRRRPVLLIDELVEDLEVLHLMGRRRVPDAYRERVEALRAVLPADLRLDVRTGITITHLLDVLFDLRAILVPRLASTWSVASCTTGSSART